MHPAADNPSGVLFAGLFAGQIQSWTDIAMLDTPASQVTVIFVMMYCAASPDDGCGYCTLPKH